MNFMDMAQLLGNFGELFGAIAVVATLAYLALRFRKLSLIDLNAVVRRLVMN